MAIYNWQRNYAGHVVCMGVVDARDDLANQ